MKCEKIREIILTDYLDNELDKARRDEITIHLSQCPACSALAANAQQTAIEPFFNSQSIEPPAYLWKGIKAALEPDYRTPASNNIGAGIFSIFRFPRAVFALSSTLAAVLISLVIVKSPQYFQRIEYRQLAKAHLEDQADFFTSEDDAPEQNGEADIEKYLL